MWTWCGQALFGLDVDGGEWAGGRVEERAQMRRWADGQAGRRARQPRCWKVKELGSQVADDGDVAPLDSEIWGFPVRGVRLGERGSCPGTSKAVSRG